MAVHFPFSIFQWHNEPNNLKIQIILPFFIILCKFVYYNIHPIIDMSTFKLCDIDSTSQHCNEIKKYEIM